MTTAELHPFLSCSAAPPNGGRPVLSIADLDANQREMLAEIATSKGEENNTLPNSAASNTEPEQQEHRQEERPTVDDSWSLQDIALKGPPNGWKAVYRTAVPELAPIEHLLTDGEYYPSKAEMFTAFELCPLHKVRVVIVGQDPYHNGSAVGMAFSVRRGRDVNPSLKTIFKEISTSMPDTGPFNHGDLTKWALQGVLLLNMALSVKPGSAGSHMGTNQHSNPWGGFLTTVIKAVLAVRPKAIFVLWGAKAAELEQNSIYGLKDSKYILQAGHPSPLNTTRPFLGCGHFVKINSMLQDMGEEPINWNI